MTSLQTSFLLLAPALLGLACAAEPSPLGPSKNPVIDPNAGTGGAMVVNPMDAGSGGAEMDAPIINGGTGGSGGEMMDMAMPIEMPPVDKPPPVDVPPEAPPAVPYTCNHVLGPGILGQWWPTFEAMMDTAHWESTSATGAYVDLWAMPNGAPWSAALTSPCTARSTNPDRVLLIVYSTTLNTQQQYITSTTAAVATIKMKYPGVKRIELLTTVRSPNNQLCPGGDPNTVVPAAVDAALAAVAAASAGEVVVGPKIAVQACAWWSGATTALAGAGPMGVGALYADYYQTHL